MKDETVDALELLRSQHEEVDSLIEKIENTDDAGEKQALFIEMADKLAAHSTIEEKIFYPSVMEQNTRVVSNPRKNTSGALSPPMELVVGRTLRASVG